MKVILIVLAIAIIVAAIWYWRSNASTETVLEDESVFCTLDAKLCPDGSYVGRVPPNCEFRACSAASSPNNTDTNNIDDSMINAS